MNIGILNYSDVRNFGDVLFPLIITQELRARIPNIEIVYITATGSSFAGMDSFRLDKINFERFDGLLLGGGEIVHRCDSMLKHIYKTFSLCSIERPTDIVFSWTNSDTPYKAWISLGVPPPENNTSADIEKFTAGLNLIGSRDSYSYCRLLQCGAEKAKVRLTPDIGWLFPRLLDGRRLPIHPARGNPYLVFQGIFMDDLEYICKSLKNISTKTGLSIVLLPLTRCWQDSMKLSKLYHQSNREFYIVDDNMDDIDKLAILGMATLYIGQSMHGLIGAIGQNRPGGLIYKKTNDKFTALLEDLDLPNIRQPDWDGLESLVHSLMWMPSHCFLKTSSKMRIELDVLFDDIAKSLIEQQGHIFETNEKR